MALSGAGTRISEETFFFQTRHTHASFYIFAVYIIKDRFALPHNRRTIFHPADRVIGETNFQFIRKLTDSETNFLRIRGYAFFRYNHIHRIKLLTTVIIRPPQTGRLQFQCLVNIRSKDNRFPLLRCKVYFLSHLFFLQDSGQRILVWLSVAGSPLPYVR